MKWISVKDRLPPCRERVLVSGDDGIFRAYREEWPSDSWLCCPSGDYDTRPVVHGITHWCNLPLPPIGNDNDEPETVQWEDLNEEE